VFRNLKWIGNHYCKERPIILVISVSVSLTRTIMFMVMMEIILLKLNHKTIYNEIGNSYFLFDLRFAWAHIFGIVD
jgi:hypothetical protein